MSGWVCSYRKIWEHPIFKGDGMRVAVWHWMLHKAAWKETRFKNNGNIVILSRGQLCVSQRQICTETGISHRKLRTFLVELENDTAITQDTTQGRSIITICNYEKYQDREPKPDTASDTETTQERHTKEQYKQKNNPSNEGNAAAPPNQMIEVLVSSSAVWNAGKPFLASRGVSNSGAMIGRWLKSHKPIQVLQAIEDAQRAGTQDPVPYITQTLENGGKSNAAPASKRPTYGRDYAQIDADIAEARRMRAERKKKQKEQAI